MRSRNCDLHFLCLLFSALSDALLRMSCQTLSVMSQPVNLSGRSGEQCGHSGGVGRSVVDRSDRGAARVESVSSSSGT